MVQRVEDTVCIGEDLLLILELQCLEPVLLADDLGDTLVLLGDLLGDHDLILLPVLILDKAHALHVLGVVGIVVDRSHRTELVEALDKHPFVVKVREAHGPLEHILAAGLTPVGNSLEERIDDFIVIDEVNEAEAYVVLVPRLVGAVIDDPCDTPDDTPIAVGEEVCGFAELKGGVACWVQREEFVLDEPRYVIRIALVELEVELDELPQVCLFRNLSYFDCHILSLSLVPR